MKKNFKKVLISGLTALAFAGISVGTTFALFTDEEKTNVEINSGKITVQSALSGIKTYSAEADPNGSLVDERGGKYSYAVQPEVMVENVKHYMFANDGYATFNEETNELSLKNITPGDKIVFSVDPSSASNVSYKYRFVYKVANTNYDLSDALTTTIKVGEGEAKTYEGLRQYRSAWELHQVGSSIDALSFAIEFPIDKGNAFQNKDAEMVLTLEAVQGNANTGDENLLVECAELEVEGLDFEDETKQKQEAQDLVIEASNDAEDVSVKVTIPAASTEVDSGDNVTLKVSEAEIATSTTDNVSTLNFDVTLEVNGTKVSSYTQPIAVEINIGPGYHIQAVTHNGTALAPTDFSYDPAEGIVRFSTTSFSPFSVSYYVNSVEVTTYEELKAAALQEYTVINMKNDVNVPLRTAKSGMAGAREVFEPQTIECAKGVIINGNNHALIVPSFYVDSVTLNAILTLNGAIIKLAGDNVTLSKLTIDCSHQLNQMALINANEKDGIELIDCTFFGDLDYIGAGQAIINVTKDLLALRVNVYDMMGFIYEGATGNELTGEVIIRDSVINTCNYTFNFGAEHLTDGSVLVEDSTLRGWTSFANLKLVKFKNVDFKKTVYSDNTDGSYNFVRAYSDVEFDYCSFYEEFKAEIVNGGDADINNCLFKSGNELVALTPALYSTSLFEITFDYSFASNTSELKIDDTLVAHSSTVISEEFPLDALKAIYGENVVALEGKTQYELCRVYVGNELQYCRVNVGEYANQTAAGEACTAYEGLLTEAGFTSYSGTSPYEFQSPTGNYIIGLKYGKYYLAIYMKLL